jgi:hypothetical protein
MFEDDQSVDSDFYGVVLKNGIKIPYGGSGSTTGLKYATYEPNGNGSVFGLNYKAQSPNPAAKETISSFGVLGFFDDPREAAYTCAYFDRNPTEMIKKFESLPPGKGRRTAIYKGALAPKFPPDLYTAIPIDPAEIKAKAAEKAAKMKKRTVGTPAKAAGPQMNPIRPIDTGAWKDLLHTNGLKGGQIAAALTAVGANGGNNQKNIETVLSIKEKSAKEAVDTLKQLGLDLSNPAAIQKIKGMQPLSESAELDRIKQLIKY